MPIKDYLNPELCYVRVDPQINSFNNDAPIPDDWVNRLQILCAQQLNLSTPVSFAEHVGETSTYRLKHKLIDSLQLIYKRMTVTVDNVHNESEKQVIALKLTEGVELCSEGFHDRVEEIVSGFALPHNLDALLTSIRKGIVESAATSYNDEVHTNNRMFVLASTKYGVKPYNDEDSFIGEEDTDDESMLEILAEAFATNYTHHSIYAKSIDNIMAMLHIQFGYEGALSLQDGETGYTCGAYDKFLSYIKMFCPLIMNDLDQSKMHEYLVVDTNFRVVDLNWPKIQRVFFQNLIVQNYLTFSPEEKSVFDWLLANDQTMGDVDTSQPAASSSCQLIPDLNLLFKEKFILNTLEFFVFLSCLDPDQVNRRTLLTKAFIQSLDGISKTIALSTLANIRQLSLEQAVAQFGNDNLNLSDMFMKLEDQNNILMIALKQGIDCLEFLLNEFSHLPAQTRFNVLIQQNEKGHNLLMLAVSYYRGVLPILLAAMSDLEWQERESILLLRDNEEFTILHFVLHEHEHEPELELTELLWEINRLNEIHQQNLLGYNASLWEKTPLAQAMYYQPQILGHFLTCLKIEQRYFLLNNINEAHETPLMIAIRYCQNAVYGLLDAIKTFPQAQQQKLLQGSIMYAVKHDHPVATKLLMNHIKTLDDELIIALLTETNKKGLSPFMSTVASKNLSIVTDFLQRIISMEKPRVMAAVFEQRFHNKKSPFYGCNGLMLALRKNVDCVQFLLKVLLLQPEQTRFNVLGELDENNCNLLTLAFIHSSDAFSMLLEVLHDLPMAQRYHLLKNVNDSHQTLLMIAILYCDNSVSRLLDVIKAFPLPLQAELLQRSVIYAIQKNRLGAINLLMDYIKTLDDEELAIALLTKTNNKGLSPFMLVVVSKNLNLLGAFLQGIISLDKPRVMAAIFQQRFSYKMSEFDGCNVLMFALKCYFGAVIPLIEVMKQLSAKDRKIIVSACDIRNRNSLLLAASNPFSLQNPYAIKQNNYDKKSCNSLLPVLNAMRDFKRNQVRAILKNLDKHGHSAATLLLSYDPESMTHLMKYYKKSGSIDPLAQDKSGKINLILAVSIGAVQRVSDIGNKLKVFELEQALVKTTNNGMNALMLALCRKHPDVVVAIFELMKKLEPEIKSRIIMQHCFKESENHNLVTLAVAYRDYNSLKLILAAIVDLAKTKPIKAQCQKVLGQALHMANNRLDTTCWAMIEGAIQEIRTSVNSNASASSSVSCLSLERVNNQHLFFQRSNEIPETDEVKVPGRASRSKSF